MNIEKIDEVLVNFIKKFSLNPFTYFYEEDLRVALVSELSKNFNEVIFKVEESFSEKLNLRKLHQIRLRQNTRELPTNSISLILFI